MTSSGFNEYYTGTWRSLSMTKHALCNLSLPNMVLFFKVSISKSSQVVSSHTHDLWKKNRGLEPISEVCISVKYSTQCQTVFCLHKWLLQGKWKKILCFTFFLKEMRNSTSCAFTRGRFFLLGDGNYMVMFSPGACFQSVQSNPGSCCSLGTVSITVLPKETKCGSSYAICNVF